MALVRIKGVPIEITGINDILETDICQANFTHQVIGSYDNHGREPEPPVITHVNINLASWYKIYRTLEILPVAFLRLVDRINFGNFPSISGGGSGQYRIININYRVFDRHIRRVNFDLNNNPNLYLVTLLHEFGHKVHDAQQPLNSLQYLRRNHIELYNYLVGLPIGATRQTTGAEERYADAFADYYRWGAIQMQTNDRRRYQAFTSCPPFGS